MAKIWSKEEQANWQKHSRDKSYSLAKYNGCRSCLLWQKFGIALVSPIIKNLRLPAWFKMKRKFKEGLYRDADPSKVESNYEAKMVDVDLKDANGTIWELRMIWMQYEPGDDLPHVAGKVFDRRDPNKRILFHIENEGCTIPSIVASEEVLCAFEDYEEGPVYNWFQFTKWGSKVRYFGDWQFLKLSSFRDQPSFLVAMALHVARIDWNVDVCADGFATTEMMIRRLGKCHQGSANENNLAAQVLSCKGIRKLVASYAAEPYLPLSRTDQRNNALGWFTEDLELFVESQRCQENGDSEGARRAMDAFWNQENDWFHYVSKVGWGNYDAIPKIFNYSSLPIDYNPCQRQYVLENLPNLILGLETDETVFPSKRHSGTKRKAEEVE